MNDQAQKALIDVKDLYKTLLDTRNLEISLFWQRSNYFLVLNTGMAFGFFHLEQPRYTIVFAALGLFASLLWFRVCLGSKFWQARWEQRLLDFEKEHLPGIEFFAAGPERIKLDVEQGLAFHRVGWTRRLVNTLVLRKPSVSYSMILLSVLFMIGWVTLLVTSIVHGADPLSCSGTFTFRG